MTSSVATTSYQVSRSGCFIGARGSRRVSIGRFLGEEFVGQGCAMVSRMTSVGTGRDLLGKGALTKSIHIFLDTFGGPGIFMLYENFLPSLYEGDSWIERSPLIHTSALYSRLPALVLHTLLGVISSCSQGSSAFRLGSFQRLGREAERYGDQNNWRSER